MAFKQKEGVQEGAKEDSGEFLESEAGEIMKSGLTTEGKGLKNFKELSAEEAELSIEFSGKENAKKEIEKISVFA